MTQSRDDRLDRALLWLIGAVLLGGIMGILDGTMVAVAIDTLATDFQTPLSTIGWVSAGYLVALTVTIPITTWATDRFGGRRLWLFGLLLFLLGSLASGLAWNVISLIIFRLLQGVGAGILDPLVLTLLARAAGPHRAGRVMGLMGLVLPLGPVIGPVVGGVVLDGLGWRWIFLINLPIGVVAFVLALRVVTAAAPGPERPADRLDVLGVALVGPGVAFAVLALLQMAESATPATWSVLAPLAAGAILLTSYTIHALRPRRTPPLIDLRLFARRSFSASVTVQALVGVASFSTVFSLPLYYQQMRGFSALAAGLLVAPMGLGAALTMPVAGRLSDRLGARGLVPGGAVAAALSALALTRVGGETPVVWPALATLGLGLGLGVVAAPTMGSLYRTLPGHLVPQGSTVLYMLNQLGASIGIAVVALIVETAGRVDPLRGLHGVFWWVLTGILVILAGSQLLPGRPTPTVAAPADAAGTEVAAADAERTAAEAEGTAGGNR